MLTIDGLVTGIDTSTIIEGLLEIQQRQIDRLESRKQQSSVKQTAFAGVETRLLTLRNSLSKLTSGSGDVFRTKVASSSDESAVVAAASSDAAVGAYQLTVEQLAQSHQIGSQGFADASAEITEGELQIQVGAGSAVSITIDSSNNTLQGLADTINRSSSDVSASIINDGSGAESFRLLLTSNGTGADNEIKITNDLGNGAGAAVKPEFDLENPIQQAVDAIITLGAGAGAIQIRSGTNQVDEAIPGLTVDLLEADPLKTLQVKVAFDAENALEVAREFVESYNAFMDYVDEQAKFIAETNQSGPLLGNRSVISVQDDLRLALTEAIGDLSPELNRLTAAGFSFDDKSRLSLDESRLTDLLQGRVPGADADDVARLFGLGADSDSSGLAFVLGSSRTQAGNVQVDITSAAERADLTAASRLSRNTDIDSTNNVFQIRLDGQSVELTLEEGRYKRQELADALEQQINAHPDLQGREVLVSLSDRNLRLQSAGYGSSSEIFIESGSALAALGFDAGQTDRGQDVVGSFLVDGEVEIAAGRGRLLVGDSENPHTADLQVRVTLTPSQVVAGEEGRLTVTKGIAARLDSILSGILDPVSGRIKTENDRFDGQIASIDESIERLNQQFETQQQALVRQFVALESTVNDLQNTGSFLASQLASIAPIQR